MNKRRLYIEAIKKWHTTAQINVAIEECGELIKALAKYYRADNPSSLNVILEEMADVEIMIEQLKIIFDYKYSNESISKFSDIKRQKLERLEKRLKE